MYQPSSPTGHSLQISDSYALNTGLDFEIVSKIFPLELSKEKKSVFFKESGLIIFRNQKLEIFVDAMKQTQCHQHFGRPNILIYLNNLPLIIDSGCCNYDRTVKDSFFHRAHAHNVVVIPEFEDIFDTRQKMAEHMEQHSQLNIKECIMDERRMEAVIVHSVNNHEFGYTWERIIAAEGKRIRITDRIRSDKSITCRQVFHMAPWNMLLSEDKSTAKIFAGNEVVVFEQANKNTKLYADFQPAYDFNNNMTYSQVLTSTLKGTECEFEMLIYV